MVVSPFLDPRDYEFGNVDLAESVKEEKKRKKLDAIADDMFNSEKVFVLFNLSLDLIW